MLRAGRAPSHLRHPLTVRLLFVCKSLPFSFKGGIQTHVWELSQHLIALGYEVSILTGGKWRQGIHTEMQGGRKLIFLPYLPGRRLPILQKTVEDVAFNLAAYRWLKKNAGHYDHIHLQGRSGCFFAARDRSAGHPPVVTTFHRLLAVEYEYDGQRTGKIDGMLHRYIMGRAEALAAKHSNHLVAVSQEMKRELHAYFGDDLAPISILPNGVSQQFGEPITDPKRWQMVFVGRLEKIKGVYTMLEAMREVDPQIELIVIGDGPERRDMETFVIKHQLRRHVRFLGDQDAESVRYWIQRSHALILPSFHESQGIVLLEAGICGRPVIAASAPGIDEVIKHGHNGLLYPPGDVECLTIVTNHLFHDLELAKKLGQAGRQRALTVYNWEQIASATHQLYLSLQQNPQDHCEAGAPANESLAYGHTQAA